MATIRKSSIKDLDNIAEIENSSFSKPWSIEQLRATISKIFIAEEKKEIKGFIAIDFILDEVHILHMAVHPDYRRQGIGKLMIRKAFEFPANKFFLEVRESNYCAQKLYEGFGFKVISKRKNYYQDNNETAFVMEKKNG